MAKTNLSIIGKSRLTDELIALARDKSIDTSVVNDATAVSPNTTVVIDTLTGPEDRKRASLQRLDASLPASVLIVTSCLSAAVTHLASWTKKPERIVGFATFYPLADRKIIEISAGLRTADSSLQQAEQLFKGLGKEAVRVKDAAGLTFPRILSLIINEAARSLEEGVATAEEIDIGMKLGVNYPQGPLRWGDQIGLDEVLAVLEGLHRETGDDRYRPTPLLKKLVTAGMLGEISGQGFYSHPESQVKS